jgi:hypothetical protein
VCLCACILRTNIERGRHKFDDASVVSQYPNNGNEVGAKIQVGNNLDAVAQISRAPKESRIHPSVTFPSANVFRQLSPGRGKAGPHDGNRDHDHFIAVDPRPGRLLGLEKTNTSGSEDRNT